MKARYTHTQTVVVGVEHVLVDHAYEHSAPMSTFDREAAYHRQNGERPMTARQYRQLEKMSRRALSRNYRSAA